MNDHLGRLLGWGRQGLLTLGAVLGVICILLTLGAAVFGLRPLVFESGSMSPTIQTGDLAISHEVDASSLHRGDIVSVPTDTGTRVTHRIVSVEHIGTDAVLRLRGDANHATDAASYHVGHADRVLFHLPRLGYVVGWLSGPMGLFLLGLYAAFMLAVLVKGSPTRSRAAELPIVQLSSQERVIPKSRGGKRKAPRRSRSRTMVSGGLAVAVLAGVVSGAAAERSVTPTLAAWTDQVAVAGTTLSAATVAQPTITSCSNTPTGTGAARHITLTWPGVVTPALDYNVKVDGIAITSATVTGTTTKSVDIEYDATRVAGNQGTIATVSISAQPTGTPAWAGPVATWPFKTRGNSNPPLCGESNAPVLTVAGPTSTPRTIAEKYADVLAACPGSSAHRFVCGTVTDDSDVVVTYQLKGPGGQCLNSNNNYAPCSGYLNVAGEASSAGTWYDATSSDAGLQRVYPTAGTYTLTVNAVDDWGNTAQKVVTFTLT